MNSVTETTNEGTMTTLLHVTGNINKESVTDNQGYPSITFRVLVCAYKFEKGQLVIPELQEHKGSVVSHVHGVKLSVTAPDVFWMTMIELEPVVFKMLVQYKRLKGQSLWSEKILDTTGRVLTIKAKNPLASQIAKADTTPVNARIDMPRKEELLVSTTNKTYKIVNHQGLKIYHRLADDIFVVFDETIDSKNMPIADIDGIITRYQEGQIIDAVVHVADSREAAKDVADSYLEHIKQFQQ